MMYKEVREANFEYHVNRVDQEFLIKKRNYRNKKCYIDDDCHSGFALTDDGMLCHVFSTKKGRGKVAVAKAIEMGANRLSCFEGYLLDFYKRFGFTISVVEEQKPGAPTRFWMCLDSNRPKVGAMCL